MVTDGQSSFVFFLYSNIEWGVANIGFNAGDNMRSFMVPGALTSLTRNIENGSNVDIPGLYIYPVDRRLVFDPSGEKFKLKCIIMYYGYIMNVCNNGFTSKIITVVQL